MKLIERYATASGLQICDQFLLENYYPLPIEKYIVIHASSGQPAKNYPYFIEVLSMIGAVLAENKIGVVQLGSKDDHPLPGCIHLHGKTTLHQSAHILRHALLLLANDSWLSHRAGFIGTPLVTLFGSTSAANHSPYNFDPSKTRFLESHRWGKNPSFSAQEPKQTIALIPPEKVANSVFELLSLPDRITAESRFIGLAYPHAVFEIVLDSFPGPEFLPEIPLIARLDYLFDEEMLTNLLKTGRKVNIITNKPIKLSILSAFRPLIQTYSHELDSECPTDYIFKVRGLLPNTAFFSKEKDHKLLSDLRLKFFDYCNVEKADDVTKEDYIVESLKYLNWPESKRVDIEREISETKIKSNKFILSNGKIHISKAHWKLGKSIATINENTDTMIDSPDFWVDLNHFYCFK